jgi:hypothetical protein
MTSLPPDFEPDSEPNGFKSLSEQKAEELSSTDAPEIRPLSPAELERVQNARNQLQRLFLILLGIGLTLGLVMAIALVLLLTRFGLVGTPEDSERSQEPLPYSELMPPGHRAGIPALFS